jgi:hypothetical protein
MEKAYLFDIVSKLYISTDSSPVDMQSVELCSDMIDVVLDVSGIYGLGPSNVVLHEDNADEEKKTIGDIQHDDSAVDDLVGTLIAPMANEDLVDPDSAYDRDSASVIRLHNGMVRLCFLFFFDFFLQRLCLKIGVFFVALTMKTDLVFEGSRHNVGIGVHNTI